MASKRRKGESSSSSQSYDKKRFTSYATSQRYYQVLVNKNLLPERGLRPNETDGDLLANIRRRNWQHFTSQPEAAAVNIVKEFYANATEAEGSLVMVRGKLVNVGRKAINAYYGLQKIIDCEYEEYITKDLDYSEIILNLCEPGTDWKLTATQEATNFPSTKLSRYGKAWFGFICAKLMPARHKTEVTKERAALLYCIAMGKTLDVGEMIHASIVKTLDGSTSGGLPHPSLITDLCKRVGVKWDKEEVLQNTLAPIDHSVIARYKVWAGGESHPKGLGYIITADEHGAAEPDNREHPVPPPDIVDELRRDLRHHTRRIDLIASRVERVSQRMDRQNHRLAKRQDAMHIFNVEAHRMMLNLFTTLNPSLDSVPCKMPQALPMYPPSDLDSDDETEETEEADSDEEVDHDD